MRIGICDDQKPTRDYICRLVQKNSEDHKLYCFESGKELLSFVKKSAMPDLIFLDIDFNDDMDGMAIAGKLKEKQIGAGVSTGSLPLIVFVTGMPERMQEAFAVRAFQFLVKPFDEKQFALILFQAAKEVEHLKGQITHKEILEFYTGGKLMRIKPERLMYIESDGRKLKMHLDDRVVECYAKMSDVVSEISRMFCQIHRSYIVNLEYIFTYDRKQVELKNGETIPLSKYKYKEFLDAFMKYSSRRA